MASSSGCHDTILFFFLILGFMSYGLLRLVEFACPSPGLGLRRIRLPASSFIRVDVVNGSHACFAGCGLGSGCFFGHMVHLALRRN